MAELMAMGGSLVGQVEAQADAGGLEKGLGVMGEVLDDVFERVVARVGGPDHGIEFGGEGYGCSATMFSRAGGWRVARRVGARPFRRAG